MAESIIPPQLGILNGQLKDIFGEKHASIFQTVKPFDLLFNGIPLCVNTTGIATLICSVIKSQKPQAIKEMADGSLKFSMFGHVSNKNHFTRLLIGFIFNMYDLISRSEIKIKEQIKLSQC